MAIMRVKARWTIPGAGTAYSVLHFGAAVDGEPTDTDASNVSGALRTFFAAIQTYLPNAVKVDVSPEVEVLDVASGDLMRVVQGAALTTVTGTAGATVNWSAPSGACVTWNTGGIRNARRVRGRTFLVPLASNAWDIDGTLSVGALSMLNTAATGLRGNFSGQNLGIFGRPGPEGTPAGVFHSVTGHRITDQTAILRSRRS